MEFANLILEYIKTLGPLIYLLIFGIGILESFVLTGVFIPGTILIILIGFLAAQGVLDIYFLVGITAFGAMIGDVLSFYLGLKQGGPMLNRVSQYFKVDYLKMGEDFFKKYGDKSVFIGRFIAVVRPFIPFTAGIFKMDLKIFLFWNALSALVWAALYLTLGYFFGAALNTIVLWSGRFGLILLGVAGFAVISYIVKLKLAKPRI